MMEKVIADVLLALILGGTEFSILYQCETYFKNQKKHHGKTRDMNCQWRYTDSDISHSFKTSCGKIPLKKRAGFVYCPYCGRKIVVASE